MNRTILPVSFFFGANNAGGYCSFYSDAYDSYNKWISETIHCPLISDVRDYIYNAEVFDNTDYHVNTTGRKMHTENLVEDIKNANIGIK